MNRDLRKERTVNSLISEYSTRENWMEASERHALVSRRDPDRHKQIFRLSNEILTRRQVQASGVYRIGIGGREKGREVEAWWSIGTWSQKGAIYLFVDCQVEGHRATIYCVVESLYQQNFLDAGFEQGGRGSAHHGLLRMKKRIEGSDFQDLLRPFVDCGYLTAPSVERDFVFDMSIELPPSGKYPEGSVEQVLVSKYERNRYAVAECKRAHGVSCAVCDFDFEDFYGELGMGFIHVHHLVPISSIGKSYSIDPIKDLRPVCPNCHSMLHRKGNGNDPLKIEELKEILRKNMEAKGRLR